ncbi:kinesin light chain [Xylariaceae sp. FL1651]|nr:kinesin light chain [Xylariaceae sp. FL1651]
MNRKTLQRTDYHVAWICPVATIELLPSRLMLDEEHATPPYDPDYDDNVYIFGAIAGHNLVMATCPKGMTGNVNAGRLAGPLFATFPNIRMALLVGIGGGVPRQIPSNSSTNDVHVGDVVVGAPGDGKAACIYYQSGRSHPNGRFEILGTINRPDRVLLNGLERLESDHEFDQSTFQQHAKRLLQSKHGPKFAFPGLAHDRLFQACYQHVGPYNSGCRDCNSSKLVERPARTEQDAGQLIFHRGRIATGNSVVQDGEERDRVRDLCEGALCIEMEAAGVDASRPCLVIRGISDYADSHKDNTWRSYAAGNAVVFARELLCKIPPSIEKRRVDSEVQDRHFMVPFGRNRDFVGRGTILKQLLERIPPSADQDDCQRTVVEGLGGIGKTQVALEAAYQVRDTYPDCSVFWVPAVDLTSFENAYREVGKLLNIPGIDDNKADIKVLVKTNLEHARNSSWLLIIDNSDDIDMLFQDAKLANYLPFSQQGSILFTTRNHQVAVQLDIPQKNIITVQEMDDAEATNLLRIGLKESQMSNTESTKHLLRFLANLPLAIKQASAYMASNKNVTVSQYLEFCELSSVDLINLLSKQFEDRYRYKSHARNRNPVATTWLISFEHISRQNPQAADYLKFVCFLAEKDIPISLLPVTSKMQMAEAIGLLNAYAFILERDTPGSFDVHRLVRLVMRSWLQKKGEWEKWTVNVVQRLIEEYPFPRHENRKTWTKYLPHGQAVLEVDGAVSTEEKSSLLFNIAESYYILGKYDNAKLLYRQTLQIKEGVLGREHPDTLKSMNNLALVLQDQGKYEEAETIHRQTLQIKEGVLGREHPDTLQSMNNLALVLQDQGKYEEAETIHRQTLQIREGVLGREHPNTLKSMNNLAVVLQGQGKYEEAETIHRQTLQLREGVLGREHPDTLQSINNLAEVLRSQGKYREAETIHR